MPCSTSVLKPLSWTKLASASPAFRQDASSGAEYNACSNALGLACAGAAASITGTGISTESSKSASEGVIAAFCNSSGNDEVNTTTPQKRENRRDYGMYLQYESKKPRNEKFYLVHVLPQVAQPAN